MTAEEFSAGDVAVFGLFLEQAGVDGVHAVAMLVQYALQRGELVEPEPPRQCAQSALGARKAVRLLALRHLQAVLDVAEEDVRGRQVLLHVRLDEAVGSQLLERGQRVPGAQRRLVAAVEQQEHLCEQLDFADAAAAFLDVPVQVAVPGMLPIGARLVARKLLDGGVVEILAVDEWRDELHEFPAQRPVARYGPRLEQREPLERLAEVLVVLRRLLQRIDEVPARAHRPQAHVDAIEIALGRVLAEQRREPASQPLVAVMRVAGRLDRYVIDVDQVDVGAVVQVHAAELAHADDREPSGQRAMAGRVLGAGEAQDAVYQRVGQVGQLRRGRCERLPVQHAEQVARGHPEHLPPLEPLERVHLVLDALRAVETAVDLRVVGGAIGRRTVQLAPQPVEVLGVADQDLAQERGGAEDLRQDLQHARVGVQVADEGGLRRARRDVAAEADHRGVGVGRGRERVKQQVGQVAQRQAAGQVVGELLQVLVSGAAVAKAALFEEAGRRFRGQMRGQEDVPRRDGARLGRHPPG